MLLLGFLNCDLINLKLPGAKIATLGKCSVSEFFSANFEKISISKVTNFILEDDVTMKFNEISFRHSGLKMVNIELIFQNSFGLGILDPLFKI